MDAESMNKQEQLHIKDNKTLQVEKSDTDNGMLCKVDSYSDILSKPAENMDVISPSLQTVSDSCDDQVSCRSSKQFSESSCKPMTIDIDSEVAGAVEVKSQFVLELSNDYLTQMMKNNNDRGIALYEGAFLVSDSTECSKVCSDNAKKESLLPVQGLVVTDMSNIAENKTILDKIEIDENNENGTRRADVKELMTINEDHVEKVDNKLDEFDTSRQDSLPNPNIADGTISFNDRKEIEIHLTLDKIEIVDEKHDNHIDTSDLKEKPILSDNEEVHNNENINENDTSRQDLMPHTDLLIANETSSFIDTKETEKDLTFDKTEMVDDKNNDNMENSDLKEKPMSTDNAPDEDVYDNTNIDISDTGRQDLLPNTELLIVDETNSFINSKEIEKYLTCNKIKMVDETINDYMETLDVKEKSMLINTDLDPQQFNMKQYITNKMDNEKNYMSSRENFIVDKLNGSSDMYESKNRVNIDKKKAAYVVSDGKIPIDMLENVDIKKGFFRRDIKDINLTEESSGIIAKMQNMDWLKNLGGGMEGNRRKVSRKPSLETEDIPKDMKDIKEIKEEPTEDAKLSSKSSKKRSSQSKNRKTKSVDSPKQDASEDQNKKSSSDVRSASTSKNETSKSVSNRLIEKPKDTKSNPQILEVPRSSIGRGRSDRRKVPLGYSQPKAQSDTSDQWNKTPTVQPEIPVTDDKSCNKDKAHSSAASSSVEVKKVEHVTETVVVTELSNSKKPEVCETEVESRLPYQPDDSVSLHNQSSIKNSDNQSSIKNSDNQSSIKNSENESSVQKNEKKIDVMKKQLPVVKKDEDGQSKSNKNLLVRPIYGRSMDESNPEKMPPLFVKGFSQTTYDSSKQGNCAIKSTGSCNTSHEAPRWNHSNYSNRQNTNNFGSNAQKRFTSNRHRHITEDETKQNEESFTKNQVSTDKCQGSKGYSDKCYENKTSGGRYNERNQDNRHLNYQYSDKNQDHRNHGEWNSTKNQEGKSHRDIVSDKNQSSQGDRCFVNQSNNGSGDRYSERFQDRTSGERYSDKVRDSKTSTDRYPDRNQQSKTIHEISSDRHHDENQMATKKQEPLNKNPVGFDKKTDLNQAKDKEFSNRHQTYSGNYQDTRNSSNENNELYVCEHHRKEQEQETLDKYKKQFLIAPEPEDSDKVKHNKSDVKSQKHYDNIQQAKVKKALHQFQQSFSVPTVVIQPQLSSSVDQIVKLQKDEDLTSTQPIQSGDWTPYKNASKQDAVYSADLRYSSPYTNINTIMNPTVTNEYNLQYNEALLNSSSQFDSVSNVTASEQKLNIARPFEGNQSVQRAQGVDPSHFNQNQSSQGNTNNLFGSNTNSPAPEQLCASTSAAQFLDTITSGLVDPTPTSTYPHSTMNVNAPPFEVAYKEKLNDQLMAMHYSIFNDPSGLLDMDNECILKEVLMNEISNFNEEQLKLNQEISELRRKLAIKQSELMSSQMRMFNTARATTKAILNQSALQHINYGQHVQQQNQHLPPNYTQVKRPNAPPCFGDASLNVQSTPMNVSEVSTNVANVQSYPVEKLPLNSVPGSRIIPQPIYLAQGNMLYQQQATNYQAYTDKTVNSTAYNIVPQTAEQRQIRGSAIPTPKL